MYTNIHQIRKKESHIFDSIQEGKANITDDDQRSLDPFEQLLQVPR